MAVLALDISGSGSQMMTQLPIKQRMPLHGQWGKLWPDIEVALKMMVH